MERNQQEQEDSRRLALFHPSSIHHPGTTAKTSKTGQLRPSNLYGFSTIAAPLPASQQLRSPGADSVVSACVPVVCVWEVAHTLANKQESKYLLHGATSTSTPTVAISFGSSKLCPQLLRGCNQVGQGRYNLRILPSLQATIRVDPQNLRLQNSQHLHYAITVRLGSQGQESRLCPVDKGDQNTSSVLSQAMRL